MKRLTWDRRNPDLVIDIPTITGYSDADRRALVNLFDDARASGVTGQDFVNAIREFEEKRVARDPAREDKITRRLSILSAVLIVLGLMAFGAMLALVAVGRLP